MARSGSSIDRSDETIAREYDRLRAEKVNQLFADDSTHTSRAGAELNAAMVAQVLREVPVAQFLREQ